MILIVDDEPSISAAMKAVIEMGGYSVAVANSCNEALMVLEQNRPQLIFSDINMPEHSGMELLRRLKANPDTADIPLVFVSAQAREADVQNGLAAGAAGYITKPMNPPELLTAITAIISEK